MAVSIFANETAKKTNENNNTKYIVYYFMYLPRCMTCNKIENDTKTIVTSTFKDEIASGRLEFKTVDVGKKEYAHFAKDFKLYTKSVVLVEEQNGKVLRYEVLQKVWELIHSPEKYKAYVVDSVKKFIKK